MARALPGTGAGVQNRQKPGGMGREQACGQGREASVGPHGEVPCQRRSPSKPWTVPRGLIFAGQAHAADPVRLPGFPAPPHTRVGVSRLRTMATTAAATGGAGNPRPAYEPSKKEFAVGFAACSVGGSSEVAWLARWAGTRGVQGWAAPPPTSAGGSTCAAPAKCTTHGHP